MPKTLVAEKSTATHIYPSLIDDVNEIPDIIRFLIPIMLDKANKFGEQRLRYKLETRKKTGTFDIMNNISELVTLVQIMDSLVNLIHTVSAVGK